MNYKNNPLYTMVKTPHKTSQGQFVYVQQWEDGTRRYKVKIKQEVLKRQGKTYKVSYASSWRDLEPLENEKLFESDPYSFSAFVTFLMRICKWIMPHYMEYRQRGLDASRSFDKAVINYEECNNTKLDGVWFKEAYKIIIAADPSNTISAQ